MAIRSLEFISNKEAPTENGSLAQFSPSFSSIEFTNDEAETSLASRFESVHLGPLSVFRFRGRGFTRSYRQLLDIRNDGIDDILFGLPLDIPKTFSQSGRSVVAQPGCGVFMGSLKPFETHCSGLLGRDYYELLMRIPGPLIRRHVPHMDENCVHPIQMQQGVGGVMKLFMESVFVEAPSFSPGEATQCGQALLEIIAGVIPNKPKYSTTVSSSRLVGYAVTRQRATDFIVRNLSNPKLNADTVAKHCKVSARYLYNAFEESPLSLSVSAFIREMRLSCCQKDLKNRSLLHLNITQIAFRWGFNSPSNFCRSYNTRFGKAPSEERSALSFLALTS